MLIVNSIGIINKHGRAHETKKKALAWNFGYMKLETRSKGSKYSSSLVIYTIAVTQLASVTKHTILKAILCKANLIAAIT